MDGQPYGGSLYQIFAVSPPDILVCERTYTNEGFISRYKRIRPSGQVIYLEERIDVTRRLKKVAYALENPWEYIFLPVSTQELERKIRMTLEFLDEERHAEMVVKNGRMFINSLSVFKELFFKDLMNEVILPNKYAVISILDSRALILPAWEYYFVYVQFYYRGEIWERWKKLEKLCTLGNYACYLYGEALYQSVWYSEREAVFVILPEQCESIKSLCRQTGEAIHNLSRYSGISSNIFISQTPVALEYFAETLKRMRERSKEYMVLNEGGLFVVKPGVPVVSARRPRPN